MNETTLSQSVLALNLDQSKLDDKNIAEIVQHVISDLSHTAQTYTRMLASWNHGGGNKIDPYD